LAEVARHDGEAAGPADEERQPPLVREVLQVHL
jgi:hypothetical protein